MDTTLIDDMNERKIVTQRDIIPRVNGAEEEMPLLNRDRSQDGKVRVPMHVLFNQAARICTRYNKSIRGTRAQQSFVQKVVSSIYGYSFPILFFHSMLFPKHFWCNAEHDEVSTLGCAPISCFRKGANPDGFASTLEQARTYATHASSSTSTDDHFAMHLYSIQANAASSGIDSRLATRSGFQVSTTSHSGLKLGRHDPSELTESLDSGQGAMNLAAASDKKGFDLFLTYTLNQSNHPGICHLHEWKQSRGWTRNFKLYHGHNSLIQHDYNMSMEMAYTHTVSRCWLEVRRLWLEFIILSTTTKLKKVSHAFFRDEYQEGTAGYCHIHGLLGLQKNSMENEDFVKFVCDLQANSVADIIPSDEIEDYIDKGLLKDEQDWTTVKATGSTVLPHTRHDDRCLRRKDHTGIFEQDYECRKLHPVFDSHNPLEDEFDDLPYQFSEACLNSLQKVGLYIPPKPGELNGELKHPMLQPKRHLGKVHPHARDNMSPVMGEHFAFTRSMQNMQVVVGTNGVTRYVVKVSHFLSREVDFIFEDCLTAFFHHELIFDTVHNKVSF